MLVSRSQFVDVLVELFVGGVLLCEDTHHIRISPQRMQREVHSIPKPLLEKEKCVPRFRYISPTNGGCSVVMPSKLEDVGGCRAEGGLGNYNCPAPC